MAAYNAEYILSDCLKAILMNDDAPKDSIDASLINSDRMLDAADSFQANRRKSPSVLRSIFGVFQPADQSAVKMELAQTGQSLQQSRPKSALPGSHL
jgi:hypothetical protein